jgi:hypothetical protein
MRGWIVWAELGVIIFPIGQIIVGAAIKEHSSIIFGILIFICAMTLIIYHDVKDGKTFYNKK